MAHLRRCLLSKYQKTHINENPNGGSPLLGFFLGGCTCLRSASPLARARSAPTEQKCIVYFVGAAETAAPPGSAPTAQKCTIYFVGAAETAAPPGRHQSRKHCTNRANHKRLCWGCVGMAGMPYPPTTARLNALRASSRPNRSQPRAARAADRRSASLR